MTDDELKARLRWMDQSDILAEVERRIAERDALKAQLAAVEAERDQLQVRLNAAQEGAMRLQQHRDAWRGYAYGKRAKPDDFLDGNMVDRPQTVLDAYLREAIPASPQWQLIETAPRNERILTPEGIAYMGLYGDWVLEGAPDAYTFSGPQWWMPLPPSPKKQT
jgi:hypothetical protein